MLSTFDLLLDWDEVPFPGVDGAPVLGAKAGEVLVFDNHGSHRAVGNF